MSRKERAAAILAQLGIARIEGGVCGKDGWRLGGGPKNTSVEPVHGEELASVPTASDADYEHVLEGAIERFAEWRMRPAPKRGEVVRTFGELLRRHKAPLGE